MTLYKICLLARAAAVMTALGAALLWWHASKIPIPTGALRTVDITADGSGRLAGVKQMNGAFTEERRRLECAALDPIEKDQIELVQAEVVGPQQR